MPSPQTKKNGKAGAKKEMRQKLIHKTGALQEGSPNEVAVAHPEYVQQIADNLTPFGTVPLTLNEAPGGSPLNRENNFSAGGNGKNSEKKKLEPTFVSTLKKSLFSYIVPEGSRVLVTYSDGKSEELSGPTKILKFGREVIPLKLYSAYPGEFLIVKYRDGRQDHLEGPVQVWFNPHLHSEIEREEALTIADNEAIVVYSQSEDGGAIERKIIRGPALFIPKPGEWLHTFSWHGSIDASGKKYPNALIFQKLWMMPDQMYHNVEGVRTSDDIVLTIKLMLFFQLLDLETMLEKTNDPIGDFINAATSDVVEFVGKYTFDQLKENLQRLNSLDSCAQLAGPAQPSGCRIDRSD